MIKKETTNPLNPVSAEPSPPQLSAPPAPTADSHPGACRHEEQCRRATASPVLPGETGSAPHDNRARNGEDARDSSTRGERHRVWLARAVPRKRTSAAFCAAPCTRFASRVDNRHDAWPCEGRWVVERPRWGTEHECKCPLRKEGDDEEANPRGDCGNQLGLWYVGRLGARSSQLGCR